MFSRTVQMFSYRGAARRLYESAGYRETGRRHSDRFLFIDFGKRL